MASRIRSWRALAESPMHGLVGSNLRAGAGSSLRGGSIWRGLCETAHRIPANRRRDLLERSSLMISGRRAPSLRPRDGPGSVCAARADGPTHVPERKCERRSDRPSRSACSGEPGPGSCREDTTIQRVGALPDSIGWESLKDPVGWTQARHGFRRISGPENPGEPGHGTGTGHGKTCQARDKHDKEVRSCSHPRVHRFRPKDFSTRSDDPSHEGRTDGLR